jgi:DNA-directed RNA polymerase specialized sigma24 family protein
MNIDKIDFNYWRRITRAICACNHIQNADDIEDIEQIAMLKIIGASQKNLNGDRDSYYARICRNAVIDYKRSWMRRLVVSSSELMIDTIPDPVGEEQIVDRVNAHVIADSFSPTDRDLLTLTAEGHTSAEIAELTLNDADKQIRVRTRHRTLKAQAARVNKD